MGESISELRGRIRAERRAIDPNDQADAASAIARHFVALLGQVQPRLVAGYVATDGEIDPGPALAACVDQGAALALPRVQDGSMTFHRIGPDPGLDELVDGPYGLRQPLPTAPEVDVRDIDMVLAPLVAFDRSGNRLGRGGGYYDRCFAHRVGNEPPPLLVGIAHAFQGVDRIDARDHDVALDIVVHAGGILHFGHAWC